MKKRKVRIKILNKKIKSCQRCKGLNIKGVTESSPGYGNIKSKVMIVGQSLCTKCMHTQIPFTGGSGKILDKVFNRIGISKKDIFITNLVHCHPPNNRPSKPEEINRCISYLWGEVSIVKPRLIVTLGKDASGYLKQNGVKWNRLRHVLIMGKFYSMLSMYHPAYFMYKTEVDVKTYINRMSRVIKAFM